MHLTRLQNSKESGGRGLIACTKAFIQPYCNTLAYPETRNYVWRHMTYLAATQVQWKQQTWTSGWYPLNKKLQRWTGLPRFLPRKYAQLKFFSFLFS